MKQVFILEVESDTQAAIFTARLRQALNLFLGHGAFELCNAGFAKGQYDSQDCWYTEGVSQHLGDDPKVVRADLLRVDI